MEALKKSLLAETIREDYKQQLMDYKFLSFYETVPLGKLGLVGCKHALFFFLFFLNCLVPSRFSFPITTHNAWARDKGWVFLGMVI